MSCPSCRKELDAGMTFCPYCGADAPGAPKAEPVQARTQELEAEAPELKLEIQRARFVVNQRCLAKFRIEKRSPHKVRLQVSFGIERNEVEENVAAIPGAKLNRPVMFSFPFTPKSAGEFRIKELSVLAVSEDNPTLTWAFQTGEDELSLRVSTTDTGTSGVIYNIRVDEMYGSDLKLDQGGGRGPAAPESEWMPIRLVLDSARTRNVRQKQSQPPAPAPGPKLNMAEVFAPPPPAPPKPQPPKPPAQQQQQQQFQQQAKVPCPDCAELIPPGSRVCPICGSALQGPGVIPPAPPPKPPGPNYTVPALVCGALTFFCLIGIIPGLFYMLAANAQYKRTGVKPEGRDLAVALFWGGLFYALMCIAFVMLGALGEIMTGRY
jgi:RNA polymerase subunit RPABC4/transcription elongation factor Spt4